MIRVHTDMDIAEEEPEIESVSRNIVEEESDGIPARHTSDSGQYTHTAVSISSVSSQVMESMGPDTENSQGSASPPLIPDEVQKEVGTSNLGLYLAPGNEATQQELDEVQKEVGTSNPGSDWLQETRPLNKS